VTLLHISRVVEVVPLEFISAEIPLDNCLVRRKVRGVVIVRSCASESDNSCSDLGIEGNCNREIFKYFELVVNDLGIVNLGLLEQQEKVKQKRSPSRLHKLKAKWLRSANRCLACPTEWWGLQTREPRELGSHPIVGSRSSSQNFHPALARSSGQRNQ
jgi:hypothetical protein